MPPNSCAGWKKIYLQNTTLLCVFVFPPVSSLLTPTKDLVGIELCDGDPLTVAKLEGVLLGNTAARRLGR